LRKTFLLFIRGYQLLLSPWFGGCCRFYPSCSEYAKAALAKEVWWRAVWISFKRVLKCHPFHQGGFDPV